MKTTQSTTAISQLFLQKWKKEGEVRNQFLLTPQECVSKVRMHDIQEIASVISLLTAVGFILALLLNKFILRGPEVNPLIFGIPAFVFISIFCLIKPAKLGELTQQMYFDWKEVTRSLRQQDLLLEEVLSKDYFTQQIEDKLRDLVREVEEAQGREEFRKKAKLKKKLSHLYKTLSKLDLELPVYDDLFTGDFNVRCATHVHPTVTLRVVPRSA
jgi:hypothetical protein